MASERPSIRLPVTSQGSWNTPEGRAVRRGIERTSLSTLSDGTAFPGNRRPSRTTGTPYETTHSFTFLAGTVADAYLDSAMKRGEAAAW